MATTGTNQPSRNGRTNQQTGKREDQSMQQRESGQERSTALTSGESFWPSFFERGFSGNPFTVMRRFMEDMDRMFMDVARGRHEGGAMQGAWAPQIEVVERDGKLKVSADLPGMREQDIRIEVRDQALHIAGERRSEHREERGGMVRSERSYGSFHRSIPLPRQVDAESCKATFENGVLEVTIDLPQGQAARQIPIGKRGSLADTESEKRVD